MLKNLLNLSAYIGEDKKKSSRQNNFAKDLSGPSPRVDSEFS